MKIQICGLLSLMLLAGCAQDRPEPSNVTQAADFPSAQEMARDAELTCEGACSPSVGLLTMVEGDRTLQCTASLIGPDLAITNSHCVPKDLNAGDACDSRIWMHFAKNGDHETRLGCKQVLLASDMATEGHDYAVLRLEKPSSRPVIALSRAGFPENENFTVEKVDPSGDETHVRGIQKKVSCLSVYGTDYEPSYVHPFARAVTIGNCEIRVGNSGSPVLDSAGRIRGVIFALFQPHMAVKHIRETPGKVMMENIVQMNAATNLACVAVGEDRAFPAACDGATDLEQRSMLNDSYKRMTEPEYVAWRDFRLETNPAFADFEWEIQWAYEYPYSSSREIALPRPNCLKNPEAYLQPVTLEVPRWTKDLRVDRYYRTRLWVRALDRQTVTLQVKETEGGYELVVDGEKGFHKFKRKIERCPEFN